MPNIRQIRSHVNAVDSARTITKALQMISASRLQRVQRRRSASRDAAAGAEEIASAAIRIGSEIDHPLLRSGAGDMVRIIIMGSDRGMCGGYNSRVVAAAMQTAEELIRMRHRVEFLAIGKRVAMAMRERLAAGVSRGGKALSMTEQPCPDEARMLDEVGQLAQKQADDFVTTPLYAVKVVRMKLGGQGAVTPVISQLLPLEPGTSLVTFAQYQPLPSVQAALEAGLPLAVREHTARLMAMKAATTNAEEMIRDLTQELNRVRQARITAELSEIVGGADAVEGGR
jgi:F-type H+-transporting ATPase subunit gamma